MARADAMQADDILQRRVRALARACDRAGLSTAYGHCSVRVDDTSFLVCAPRPMGCIAPHHDGDTVRLDAALPERVLGEVRIHREIYRLRADVGAVVRFVSPQLTALAALGRTPRPRHGFGAYFSPAVPMWPHAGLVRDDASAAGVAQTLGTGCAIVLSVNGAVVAGADAAQALALAIFLEDAARVELVALQAGAAEDAGLDVDTCATRATWAGRVAERQWDYWTDGDPEA